MLEITDGLVARLPDAARTWFDQARRRARDDGIRSIPELLPALPRRLGRETLGGGPHTIGEASVDLSAWRLCDAAALALLDRPAAPDELELDLYLHGDLEERTMVLRSAAARPVTAITVRLLEEVQRTNVVAHVEAAVCDSDLLARAADQPAFGVAGFDRMVLKIAFLDLPLARVLAAERHANEELSRMLQGLATEREAAGRAVWRDTNTLIARAPTRGTLARLVGGLEHGDDRHRLAAAEGLGHLARPELAPFVEERLPREPRDDVRSALQQALSRSR